MNEKRKVSCLSKCKNCTVHVADECKMEVSGLDSYIAAWKHGQLLSAY